MKCKKHPLDPSSNVGVCASCLRERLVAVIAAQVRAQREALLQQGQQSCRKSDANSQLPPFRSVSPYVSHRKSDSAATWQIQGYHRRFYSTPQVGPNGFVEKDKKSNKGRFSSVLDGLFRSKSDKTGLETGPFNRGQPVDSCAASPSWFFMFVHGRRKKQVQTFSVEEFSSKACRISDRGMSPSNVEDDEHFRDGSSGYSSESSHGWKQTPRRATATRRCKGRNASGLAFCLSPLVRPSPNRKWSQKIAPPDMTLAGEVRAPPKPQLSTASSFCKNRSRKLADFGKLSYNPPHPIS